MEIRYAIFDLSLVIIKTREREENISNKENRARKETVMRSQ